jgi:hypothetical protein
MSQVLDKVLEIVQKSQGVLPVEVASKLGVDSFLANAYLSQLAETGKIVRSNTRIGGTNLYFIPGQEKLAESKISSILEQAKKTAKMYAPEGAASRTNPEIEQKRQAFAERLREIEEKEPKKGKKVIPNAIPEPGHKVMPITIKHVSQEVVGADPGRAIGGQLMPKLVIEPKVKEPEPEEPIKEILTPAVQEKLETKEEPIAAEPEFEEVAYNELEIKTGIDELPGDGIREVIEKTFLKKPEKPMEPGPLVDAALAMLVDAGSDIIFRELKRKGKEADIAFDLPTKIGNIRMLAIVRDKKSITEADLSMAYTEGVNRKMPVVFMTNGKMTKTAQNYHQVIAGLLKFKQIDKKAEAQ